MNEGNTMQAVRYHQYGGPEELVLERAPVPAVQPGAVLVRVKASSVNPMDWKLRSGMYQQFMPIQFPYTPGLEFAGVVEEIGPDVTGFQIGQAVYGNGASTNAEWVVAPASGLARPVRHGRFGRGPARPGPGGQPAGWDTSPCNWRAGKARTSRARRRPATRISSVR